jgi:uncharacterized protein (UPF0305 family)
MTIYDEMSASAYLQEDGQYIQKSFREEYLDVTIKYFLKRLHAIKNDNNDYPQTINKSRFINSLKILKNQYTEQSSRLSESNKTPLMYTLISIYTTFILEESIHPINTPFPAGERITLKDGIYYCPVKHNQSTNPDALCRLCIAKEKEELD